MASLPAVSALAQTKHSCSSDVSATRDTAANQGVHRTLQSLFEREWRRTLSEDPIEATFYGETDYNDRWPNLSPAARARTRALDRALLAELDGLPRASLRGDDRLNYELFRRLYEDRVRSAQFSVEDYALTPTRGVQTLSDLIGVMPFETPWDYKKWLERLATLPFYIDQNIELFSQAARAGGTQPRIIIERVLPQVGMHLAESPERSPFYAPFLRFPRAIPEGEQRRLATRARQIISTAVVPAYRRFDVFLRTEYLPVARSTVGIWDTPEGELYYQNRIQHFTTTTLTAGEVHALGLREVERIRAEMDGERKALGFRGTLRELLISLRTDKAFYYASAEDLFRAYVVTAKQIEPQLPRLFRRLYCIPFGVRPFPAVSAPNSPAAGYDPPAADGTRAGYLNVNLFRPETHPRYEIEALTLHEAVPGHHLQTALALNLPGMPAFRRFSSYTVYVEGWALYAEGLGEPLGVYRDPYSRLGRQGRDMWRAIRLVVDTGIHAQRWSRDQALEYCRANSTQSEIEIVNEVDRYIAWPGQALAYKIGQLELLKLRARTQSELGPKFDLREFHDCVLGSGAVPLDVLEEIVIQWMNGVRAEKT